MAGAPDDENERETNVSSRVRRLAWVGWSAAALAVLGLIAGFVWLSGIRSFESDDAPDHEVPVAAAPPATNLGDLIANRNDLPPSVRNYLDNTIYPPGTGRLAENNYDLLSPNSRHEDFRPIPETFSTNGDEVVSVRLTSDRYYYEGDDPIELTLAIRQGTAPIEALSISAGATREGRGGLKGNRVGLRFIRDRNSEELTARLDPARFADHHGPILVDAQIEYQRGVVHEETMRLFLTPEGQIPARFTGEVEDVLSNGSLLVEIGIDVENPGFYRIDANLYDRTGAPLAYSAFKGDLGRGDSVVPIEFFGRLLLDAGARGPFTLGEIRGYRFIDGGYPDRERIPDLPGRYPTDDYGLTSFAPDEYMSPDKQRMVDLLMEDVARGIAIDAPPVAAPIGAIQ